MKFILCTSCRDMVLLRPEERKCECGRVKGRYLPDGFSAEVSESALVFGILNKTVAEAIRIYRQAGCENPVVKGRGINVTAFLMPKSVRNITWGGDGLHRCEDPSHCGICHVCQKPRPCTHDNEEYEKRVLVAAAEKAMDELASLEGKIEETEP